MTRSSLLIVVGSFVTALLSVALIRAGRLPTGVPGEWEWLKQRFAPEIFDLALAGLGLFGFALFAALGMRALEGSPKIRREGGWVAGLWFAAIFAQISVQSGGPIGQGMTKWSTLGMHGASGYFGVAKEEISDPWRFWAEYPTWIKDQGVLHIGTHPPGLLLVSHGLLKRTGESPTLTSAVTNMLPFSAEKGIRTILELERWNKTERAAIVLMGFLTLLASSATVIPIYALARASLPSSRAWAAAAMWPMAPSIVMFQPAADTAFPLLATTALALVAAGGFWRAFWAGIVLAIGIQFSLVFLPVGLTVALIQAMRRERSVRVRAGLTLSTGVGFLTLTLFVWAISKANPFAIWWVNQTNHGRFYQAHPRLYLAWVVVNPIELSFGVGFPTTLLALAAIFRRKLPASSWAGLLVLLLMNFSGKNLSEVARLWIPLMPPVFVAAGAGLSSERDESLSLGAILLVLGVQTLALQATLQVVSPT